MWSVCQCAKNCEQIFKKFWFYNFWQFFLKFYIWTYCHTAAVEQSRSRGLCSWGILLWYIYPWKRSKHKLYCWFRFMASCVLSVQWKCVKSSNALSLAFQMPPIEQLVSITVTHTEWNSICHIVTVEKFAVGDDDDHSYMCLCHWLAAWLCVASTEKY